LKEADVGQSGAAKQIEIAQSVGGHSGLVERLPITGLSKVVGEDGRVYFISDNRRFVFRGTMHDLWSGSDIAKEQVSSRVDTERFGVSIERMSYAIGSGEKKMSVFVAPGCEPCKTVVERLITAERMREYTMRIVPLSRTEVGHHINRVLWCSKDYEEATRAVFVDGTEPKSAAPAGEDCDQTGLFLAMEAAKLFGVAELPLIIDENRVGTVGVPDWL